VNQYSTWEVPHMAQTCPDNPAVLHVNSERVILRVVREDGRLAAPGQRGRVVITSLSNFVMPFISSELGDWAVAGGNCPCGRGFPTVIDLDGRAGEMIRTPSGKTIAPATLTNFLTFHCHIRPHIWEYQAVQISPETVLLKVVPTSRFSAEVARRLKDDLEEFLGPGVTALVETHDSIPREPSGKRLLIKSDLLPPEPEGPG
jgi:phenylacetate-CoA ligase